MGKAARVRFLCAFVIALGAALLLVSQNSPARADVGECVTVQGEQAKARLGKARVCLVAYDPGAGTATLEVSKQARNQAPYEVYVRYGFGSGGVTDGFSRLGPSGSAPYTKHVSADGVSPDRALVRLCYDAPGERDRCFAARSLDLGPRLGR